MVGLSLKSPRYEVEYALEANSRSLEAVKDSSPDWFTVVAQMPKGNGEYGWTLLNTTMADGNGVLTFVTPDKELAMTMAKITIADNKLPAYVKTIRGIGIGLPEGNSPYWNYEKGDWDKNPVII